MPGCVNAMSGHGIPLALALVSPVLLVIPLAPPQHVHVFFKPGLHSVTILSTTCISHLFYTTVYVYYCSSYAYMLCLHVMLTCYAYMLCLHVMLTCYACMLCLHALLVGTVCVVLEGQRIDYLETVMKPHLWQRPLVWRDSLP